MKSIRRILLLAISVSFYSGLTGPVFAVDWPSTLAAIESTTPTPASEAPAFGTFYSAQFAGKLPPTPFLPMDVPFWSLGNGVYVYDDLDVGYPSPQPAVEPQQSMSFASSFKPSPPPCGTGGQPYITNLICSVSTNGMGMTVQFDITGGMSNVIYDILTTTNLTPVSASNSTWTWIGQGYTCDTYVFYNQPNTLSYYVLAPAPTNTVVAWGDDTYGQSEVPGGLRDVVALAAGYNFSLALQNDGTVVAWGANYEGETNVPAGLSNIVAIAAGPYHALALLGNGTVTNWGSWWEGGTVYVPMTMPSGLTNVIGIAAGSDHDLAVKADGTVVAWGYTNDPYNTVPAGISNAIAVTSGWDDSEALLSNGNVIAWGYNSIGGLVSGLTNVPPNLTNATAVSMWALHTLALRSDKTVEAWGYDADGETNIPAGLSNVIAIGTGEAYSIALQQNGTVSVWGDFGDAGPGFVPEGLPHTIAIGSGANHCLALCYSLTTPLILLEPKNSSQLPGSNVTFSVRTQPTSGVSYQWQFDGTNIAGATNSSLTLTNVQTTNDGEYDVVVSDSFGSLSSSNATLTVVTAPIINSLIPAAGSTNILGYLTNLVPAVVATAPDTGQYPLYYQWFQNGVPIAGATTSSYDIAPSFTPAWQSNRVIGQYSVKISNIVGVVQSGEINVQYFSILFPGMAAGWGSDGSGESDYPNNLTDAKAIAAGQDFSVAVHDNGTLVAWGDNEEGQTNIPIGLSNVVEVASGYDHSLALKADGTVVAWGNTNGPADYVPTNLTGVVAIAAGWNHNVALLTNGTVTAWGADEESLGWNLTDVPSSATNVTAITVQALHSLALRSDGTIVAWGDNSEGETNVPAGLSNVVAIAAGGMHNLALKVDGTVVAWGDNSYGQTNVPAGLNNVISVAAGWAHSVALKNDGTLVAWGDNFEAQTNMFEGLRYAGIKSISASGNHSLALVFSPRVQYYPIDVSKDLLLIYNTNSTDSATVLNYYLANRPGVSNANVVGIGYTNFVAYDTNGDTTNYTETITPGNCTNFILAPVSSWLAANPTKRPQYVVLFLDVPSRVFTNSAFPIGGYYPQGDGTFPSVSSQLASLSIGWNPMPTHINMNGTNDCIAYIHKIAAMATNSGSGPLFVSASADGYGNTNFYFDDTSFGVGGQGGQAKQGVLQNGAETNSVTYTDSADNGLADHITNGYNLAGYLCCGAHSSLGSVYALNNNVLWSGNSAWWIIETIESFNGQRFQCCQGHFTQWFSQGAFGGTDYSSTPIGAVSHTDEPKLVGVNDGRTYFGLWQAGKCFSICAWVSKGTQYFQAVGDPFVQK